MADHLHTFTANYSHFGPYGDQSVHYHVCFDEGCDRVLIGAGRECRRSAPHSRRWLTEDGPVYRRPAEQQRVSPSHEEAT